MTQSSYRQLILDGIEGLPPSAMVEIVDFVYFVRKRVVEPQTYEEERRGLLLRNELRQLSGEEQAHLEKEFENYQHLCPREI